MAINKDRSQEPKVLRLKQIYDEVGFKSVNAFCKYLNVSQPTTYNYMCGYRTPSNDYMLMIAKAFPQYNLDWVVYGTGEKYNPDMVDVKRSHPDIIPDRPNQQAVQITQMPQQQTEGTTLMAHKLAEMAEKMATLAEKLVSYTEKCSTLESQLKSALEVIEEFKREKQNENK